MSLSSEPCFWMSQGAKRNARSVSTCAPSQVFPASQADDFVLNKSHPCAQTPQHKKNLLALQYHCDSVTGKFKFYNLASACSNISRLHWSPVSLPHPSTASQTDENIFSQLISSYCVLSQTPVALNPNKVILTVGHDSQEVLSNC